MAKFIYKMQNILDVKIRLEDQAKTAYSNAKAKLDEEEAKLQMLQDKRIEYENKTKASMQAEPLFEPADDEFRGMRESGSIPKRLNIQEIMYYENAIETTKYHIKLQIVKVRQAERNLEIAREKLNKAMMERKTLEKLKENAFEKFRIELDLAERKEVDELVSFKYNNNTSGEEE